MATGFIIYYLTRGLGYLPVARMLTESPGLGLSPSSEPVLSLQLPSHHRENRGCGSTGWMGRGWRGEDGAPVASCGALQFWKPPTEGLSEHGMDSVSSDVGALGGFPGLIEVGSAQSTKLGLGVR